jgi:hypothetical protein
MANILEELKLRHAAAKKRHEEATLANAAALKELTAAQTELNAWSWAVNLETAEEAKRAAQAKEAQLELPETIPKTLQTSFDEAMNAEHVDASAEPINKTEVVRAMLRQHPSGMSSSELWKEFQIQAPKTSRAYLYSVIKRLKDRDQLYTRRGKYILKQKMQEATNESVVVQ